MMYLLVLSAGAILPLAFAPFGFFWLAPVSYAALFYAWGGVPPRRAFALGFAYGLASFIAGLHWIYVSVHDFGLLPVPTSVVLTIALPTALAVYVGAAGWVAARWLRASGPWAWFGVFPALWVLAEWARGWLFSGFGWLAAGYSQTDSWLMGFAPVVGVHGMSWLVMILAGSAVALVVGNVRQRAVAAAIVAAVFGIGRLNEAVQFTEPKSASLSVALVQGAVPQTLKWEPEQLPATFALYRRLTEASHGHDLIVWPEAAIPDYYENHVASLEEIARDAAGAGSALMFGILKWDGASSASQNVLVAMTAPPSVYVKRHLVPFGEFYPVPGFVRAWLKLMNLPASDMAAGAAGQPPLAIAGELVGATICYEDVFGAEQLHYLPEATLLVNVSNDAWFGNSIAPHQHLQIARLRAAEAGRYMLRATNTGISAIIDPRGAVTATLPLFEPGVLSAPVQGHMGLTPYARFGNAPIVLGALLVLALAGARGFLVRRV